MTILKESPSGTLGLPCTGPIVNIPLHALLFFSNVAEKLTSASKLGAILNSLLGLCKCVNLEE